MPRAIFVCTGNICRSPMGERLFQHALTARGLRGMAISMGTMNLRGKRAARHAVTALRELHIPLEDHRSQGVSAGMLARADVVFAMEHHHRDAIARLAPNAIPKTVLLGQFDPQRGAIDIADPVNQDITAFRTCRDQLKRCIDAWLDAYQENQ